MVNYNQTPRLTGLGAFKKIMFQVGWLNLEILWRLCVSFCVEILWRRFGFSCRALFWIIISKFWQGICLLFYFFPLKCVWFFQKIIFLKLSWCGLLIIEKIIWQKLLLLTLSNILYQSTDVKSQAHVAPNRLVQVSSVNTGTWFILKSACDTAESYCSY